MSNKGAAVWAAEMSCGMAGHACRMLFGEDGQIMEATPLLLERLGYSQEELLAKKLWDLVPTENAFHLRGKLASLSTNGKFHLLRVRLLNKSGFPVFVQLSGEALEVGGRRCIRCSVSESGVRQRIGQAYAGEHTFLAMFEHNSTIMMLLDPDSGVIADANPAAAKFYGYARESFCGMHISVINQLPREEIARLRQKAKNKEQNDFVFPHRLASGHIRQVEVLSSPIELQGQVLLLSIVHDITDQHMAEAALQASEANLRAFLDALPEPAFLLDREGELLIVNHAVCIRFAKSSAELLGHKIYEFLPGEVAEYRRDFVERVFTSKQPVHFTDQRGDCWFDHQIFPVLDATGAVGRVAVISIDITEHIQAEAQVRKLAQAMEQAAESFVMTDLQGDILYVNPAFKKISGYTAAETKGQSPRVIKSGKQDAAFYKNLWDTITRGEVWRGRLVNKRKDGTLYEESAIISPLRNAAGVTTNYMAIKVDITRERQLEEQIQQSERTESVGRLAGGIAHDFNNILQIIMGNVELLLKDLPEGSPAFESAQEVFDHSIRAADLTRQLLAYSRRQMLTPVVMDFNSVLEESLKILRKTLNPNIKFELRLGVTLPSVRADLVQMQQIVINLAINASETMPKGGQLTLETTRVVLDEISAKEICDARAGEFVCFSITDTGLGISADLLPHIFEPFYSKKGMGSGLGLSVIHGIVHQHQGWINVVSREGQGSTFRVYLPALPPDVPKLTADTAPVARATARGRGERILLVDDEEALRTRAQELLRSSGYEVLSAGTAEEALALFEKESSRFDVLFSDIALPGVNGIALAEQLRQKDPKLLILLVSGYSDHLTRWPAIEERHFGFLQKPYLASALLNHLRQELDKRLMA